MVSELHGASAAANFNQATRAEDCIGFASRMKPTSIARIVCDFALALEFDAHQRLLRVHEAFIKLPGCDRPSWSWARSLARYYAQLGRLRDAESQFRIALASTRMSLVVTELAGLYLRQDQSRTALELVDVALEKWEGEICVYLQKALIHHYLHDDKSTISSLQAALRLNPAHIQSLSLLSATYSGMDDHEASLQCHYHLNSLCVGDSAMTGNLTLGCFRCRHFDLAFTHATCLLENEDEEGGTWCNTTLAALYAGNANLAGLTMKIVLALNELCSSTVIMVEVWNPNCQHKPTSVLQWYLL
mmetsp:Transcript_36302/g.116318  ORF Transcript_36302/g.116318 Transcript_36302/m.116318 type:complete len:302 (-) Transcript_36302:822-1727(-)